MSIHPNASCYMIGDGTRYLCRCGASLSQHRNTSTQCPNDFPNNFRWPDWHTLATLARKGNV